MITQGSMLSVVSSMMLCASSALAAPALPDRDIVPITRVEPGYPFLALLFGIEGSVTVEARVGTDGSVEAGSVRVSHASPEGLFEEEAIFAMQAWRFLPRIKQGKPVARSIKQTFNFRLPETPAGAHQVLLPELLTEDRSRLSSLYEATRLVCADHYEYEKSAFNLRRLERFPIPAGPVLSEVDAVALSQLVSAFTCPTMILEQFDSPEALIAQARWFEPGMLDQSDLAAGLRALAAGERSDLRSLLAARVFRYSRYAEGLLALPLRHLPRPMTFSIHLVREVDALGSIILRGDAVQARRLLDSLFEVVTPEQTRILKVFEVAVLSMEGRPEEAISAARVALTDAGLPWELRMISAEAFVRAASEGDAEERFAIVNQAVESTFVLPKPLRF